MSPLRDTVGLVYDEPPEQALVVDGLEGVVEAAAGRDLLGRDVEQGGEVVPVRHPGEDVVVVAAARQLDGGDALAGQFGHLVPKAM